MTQNRRIAVNVLATYGRSLFALVCGLFTARWVLMTLGEVDYGLYGVVGGLTSFVSFLNGLLATAVGRFYAFSVGEAKKPGNAMLGLEECRKWFNAAVFLHTLVPTLLVLVGYPLGVWAIENFLTIPPDRIHACVWVWRFACVSCFIAMLNVPYHAMYTAKQNIAELTIYSFVTTTLNVCVLYYMVTHPADWLARYAAWMMLMTVLPQIIIGARAHLIYPECRIVKSYLCHWSYLRPILSFSGFRLLNGVSMIAANQGQALIVNKYLGPSANAAMSVGNQVAAQSQTLAAAFSGAFYPAITNAAGEGRLEEMRRLALRTSKFSCIALLIFVIPLCLEIDYVFNLWLKTPPVDAAPLCVCILITAVLDKLTDGHWMAVFALGRIKGYQTTACFPSFFAVLIGWFLVAKGFGVMGVGYGLMVSKIFTNLIRLYFGSRIAGIGVWRTLRSVVVPIGGLTLVTLIIGYLPRFLFEASFVRLVGTTAVCEVVFLSSAWFWVLDISERNRIREKVSRC